MKVSTMIIFGSNCSEFVLIWIIVLLIKILNTFWICINAGGWNDNYPEYPRPQYFTKYQMHHIVQDGLVYIYQCIHWLWHCKLVWSFEALLEGKSSWRKSFCFNLELSFQMFLNVTFPKAWWETYNKTGVTAFSIVR